VVIAHGGRCGSPAEEVVWVVRSLEDHARKRGAHTMSSAEDGFRRLTIGDPGLLASLSNPGDSPLDIQPLDARTDSLVQLAVLIELDAPTSSYRAAVDTAFGTGVRLDELLALLVSVAGAVGSARVVAAAPKIALAAGYDVEAALEEIASFDGGPHGPQAPAG
jgi:4-carboxymuconolactone decarboxylase